MLPYDVLRLILCKATEDYDFMTELPQMIMALYESGRELRYFLRNDRLFWQELFSRKGLVFDKNIENYFLYYISGEWIEYIQYNGSTMINWGYGVFLEDGEDYFVYPLGIKVKEDHFFIDKDYLCILKDEVIFIYHKDLRYHGLIKSVRVKDAISIYIKETIIGIILGIKYRTEGWRAFMLDNLFKINYLDDVDPINIFSSGFIDISGSYYRFDCSPLREWESELFSGDNIIPCPHDSSRVAILINTMNIFLNTFFVDCNTGEEIIPKSSSTLIYNMDKTKLTFIAEQEYEAKFH